MMGIKLPTKLGFKRQYYKGVINYNWVITTPLNIDLEVLSIDYPLDKIKIINQVGDYLEVFHLDDISDLSLNIGDRIIIDTEERKVSLVNSDGTSDITGLVDIGSVRPSLTGGLNIVAVDTWSREESLEATIKRKDLF